MMRRPHRSPITRSGVPFAVVESHSRHHESSVPLQGNLDNKGTKATESMSPLHRKRVRDGSDRSLVVDKKPRLETSSEDEVSAVMSAQRTRPMPLGHDASLEGGSKTLGGRCLTPSNFPRKRAANLHAITPVDTRTTAFDAAWYSLLDPTKRKVPRNQIISVKAVVQLAKKCLTDGEDSDINTCHLRQKIHQMQFWDFVDTALLMESKVLQKDGLPLIFSDQTPAIPWDIKADCKAIFQRWLSGKVDPDLLRGVNTSLLHKKPGQETLSRTLVESCKTSCDYFGEGTLTNGDWWPLQLCARRDGAHGEMEAGIHGQKSAGCYSVVLSSGGYADEDLGETIKYCGTSSKAGSKQPSTGTRHLLQSYNTKKPVRVLRSHALLKGNIYRPLAGIRYDGLYTVVAYSVLDPQSLMYRFTLKRIAGQGSLRYQGVERRPTLEEMSEWDKKRRLVGMA